MQSAKASKCRLSHSSQYTCSHKLLLRLFCASKSLTSDSAEEKWLQFLCMRWYALPLYSFPSSSMIRSTSSSVKSVLPSTIASLIRERCGTHENIPWHCTRIATSRVHNSLEFKSFPKFCGITRRYFKNARKGIWMPSICKFCNKKRILSTVRKKAFIVLIFNHHVSKPNNRGNSPRP